MWAGGEERGARVKPEVWCEEGDRGADGSDDDAAALYHVGSIGDNAELLRPDVHAELTREIK
jgi:hypothetical protein